MIQESTPQQTAGGETVDIGELMLHHTADASEIDFEPLFTLHLPHWPDFHIGPIAINLSPTKHVVFMVVAAVLVFLTMKLVGNALERQRANESAPKGLANMMEAFVLWVREEICIVNIGREAGAKFAPFIMTIFFFILYGNLLGLMPWGASFTGNLGVTVALAAMAFVTIEISGIVALGFNGYMRTIFPKVAGMDGAAATIISVGMAPIEILGKLVKPFALCFRLFGNMTAGHFVVLALLGMIFLFGDLEIWRWAIGVSSASR